MIVLAIATKYGWDRPVLEDVRINFAGRDFAFAPDVALPRLGAPRADNDTFHAHDLDFVAEVVPRESRKPDYGRKSDVHAAAGIPAYLIVDTATFALR